jgi:hypothetical protein
MVRNTQNVEEQNERAAAVTNRIKGRSVLLLFLAAGLVMGPPLGFLVLVTISPAMLADSLFFWQKRQVVRKQLVEQTSYSETFFGKDDDLCSACCRGLLGAIFTVFMTFIVGILVGARTLLGFFATASVLELAGILIAARLYSRWRHNTLKTCQVADTLPSKTIDDKDDNSFCLEMGMGMRLEMGMGMRGVQEDDTETLALAEKCASLSLDERDLEIPTA